MTTDPLTKGWRDPDDDLVQNVLARIGDRQHRRVFFDRLQNPRWVTALSVRHVFDTPPETTLDASGMELWAPWPEGEYLVRMAPLAPTAVQPILVRISVSANPYVHQLILQAAVSLQAADAQALLPAVERYLAQGTLRNNENVVRLIENLAKAGARRPAVRIAQAAFRPRSVDAAEGDVPRRRSVVAGLDRYLYEQLLPRTVAALDTVLGDRALTTVAAWLEVFQEASGEYHAESKSDLSYIWRPAIGDHSQNSRYHELGDSLVEAVRNRAIADIRRGRSISDVTQTLERSGQPLLVRIAMHVLAATAGEHSLARTEGLARLLENRLLGPDYRHEYAELARSILPVVEPTEQERWEALVFDGPPLQQDELEERAARYLQPDEELEKAVAKYREIWQLNLLSAVGFPSLPPSAALRLHELVDKYGEPSHPEFSSYMSSWSGPNSPLAQEELAQKSTLEIQHYLATWEPEVVETWGPGPSKEGLSRILQPVVADRALEFSGEAPRFADLDPTYVRAIFSGLTDAVKAGVQINWEQAIRAALTVSQHPDDGADSDAGMEEDVVWRYAHRAVAALLERGSSAEDEHGIPAGLLERGIEAVSPLIDHPDPTPDHEEQYGGSNMDPLTLSLNTTRPSAIRAITRLACRARSLMETGAGDRDRDREALDRAIQSALRLLESRLWPHRDGSLASAAAFGEELGRLIWVDRDWVQRHADDLLTQDTFGEVVLSTALATYRPSRDILDVVASVARGVVDRVAAGGVAVSGWRTDRSPIELIGDHLVVLRVQGALDADDPLLTHFFALAPVSARARVLGRVGWLLMHSDETPDAIIGRAKSLWESRAAAVDRAETPSDELVEFYWWVRSGKFDSSWWLPYLKQAASADGFDSNGMLGEALEEAAASAPGLVAEVLESLLATRDEPLRRYDLVEHAPTVIAAALDSGDLQTVETGQRIMDSLGRGGHLRIVELVEQKRYGKRTN